MAETWRAFGWTGRFRTSTKPRRAATSSASRKKHMISYRNGPPLMTYQKTFVEIERIFLSCRNGGDLVELLLTFTICR
ncbi:MAG: hypothetical protein VX973_06000 [Pseudomonadota bacterium]|jgi:hypothetical protein|nr:hypothetical protein [Pseudomonadota bacterium]